VNSNVKFQLNVDLSHRKINKVAMGDIPKYDGFGRVNLPNCCLAADKRRGVGP
jgi:hypothetical protein